MKKTKIITTEEMISIFARPRLEILQQLYFCKNVLCGCDLVEKMNIQKNLLSYHLTHLRKLGFITETRCGNRKQYRLAEDKRAEVNTILNLVKLTNTNK